MTCGIVSGRAVRRLVNRRQLGELPEQPAQFGQTEWFAKPRPVLLLQKLQGVAPNRISSAERHAVGHRSGSARPQFLVEFLAARSRHPQIRDDEVVGGFSYLCQGGLAVGGDVDLVSPRLQRGTHVMEDVRFVIHDQHAQGADVRPAAAQGRAAVPESIAPAARR